MTKAMWRIARAATVGALGLAAGAGCDHQYIKDANRLRYEDPCAAADSYNKWIEQESKGTPPRSIVEQRDTAAVACADRTVAEARRLIGSDGALAALEDYYRKTHGGAGAEVRRPDVEKVLDAAVDDWLGRHTTPPERDGIKNYRARIQAAQTAKFNAEPIKQRFALSETARAYHLDVAARVAKEQPARAYLHLRYATVLGAPRDDKMLEALLVRALHQVDPAIVWKFTPACERDGRDVAKLVPQGPGAAADALLEVTRCAPTEQRWTERRTDGPPTKRIFTDIIEKDKETTIQLLDNGQVAADPSIMTCTWSDTGPAKVTLCRLTNEFHTRYALQYPEVLQWKGDGPHVFHWIETENVTREVLVPSQRTLSRWKIEYALEGNARLTWNGRSQTVPLAYAVKESEETGASPPAIDLVRRKVLGQAATRVRAAMLDNVTARCVERAAAAAKEVKPDDAEEQYVLAALAQPPTAKVPEATVAWLRDHYGLGADEAQSLITLP